MDIKNKVAIVTGGAGGIGTEIIRALLNNGAKFVAIFDQKNSNGLSLVEKLEKEFGKGRADFYPCDVTAVEQFRGSFEKVIKLHKYVDILCNNAGIANDKFVDRIIDLNVKSVINGTILAIERMGKHKGGNGGVIINTGSIFGLSTISVLPIYTATKHAIVAFTRSMKAHYKTTGVRVMVICPGVTNTPLLSSWSGDVLDFVSEEIVQKSKGSNVVQKPDNVANAVAQMILKGENGAVWVAEDDKPPYAVKDPDHYSTMKICLEN